MCKAILRTLEKVLGDLWTPETARAWTEMWESAMEAMSKVGWEALHPFFFMPPVCFVDYVLIALLTFSSRSLVLACSIFCFLSFYVRVGSASESVGIRQAIEDAQQHGAMIESLWSR